MSRQLIGRTLVRLYPAEVRRARGNELVGTLLDAGDVSSVAFLTNAASLARSGLWARAREELGRPVGQLLVGAFCWAAVLMAMSDVVEGVGTGLFWGGSIFSFGNDPQTVIDMYVLPVLILALFTTGRNRTTGLLGLLRVAMRRYLRRTRRENLRPLPKLRLLLSRWIASPAAPHHPPALRERRLVAQADPATAQA
jgi:hypothetical protein